MRPSILRVPGLIALARPGFLIRADSPAPIRPTSSSTSKCWLQNGFPSEGESIRKLGLPDLNRGEMIKT